MQNGKKYTIVILVGILVLAGIIGMLANSMSGKDSGGSQNADTLVMNEEKLGGSEELENPEDAEYDVTEGGVHRYSYVLDDCTWTEAFRTAREMGGYLVRINSHEEYEYLMNEIDASNYEDIQFRIGGRRDIGSTDYYWVDENNNLYGEPINNADYWAGGEWLQGEPSFKDGDIEENCLDIYYSKKENRWVWNDVPDDIISIVPYYSGKLGFIVEYED